MSRRRALSTTTTAFLGTLNDTGYILSEVIMSSKIRVGTYEDRGSEWGRRAPSLCRVQWSKS
jgi:hypothetical protein